MAADASETRCPYCRAGEPSVWDDVLFHYAHPASAGDKLKFCHEPWRERCRRCSAGVGACSCGLITPPFVTAADGGEGA